MSDCVGTHTVSAVGSRTAPFCHEPTDALRAKDSDRLSADLGRYLAAAEPGLQADYRDVLVGLAPYFDCAQRLAIDPIQLFDTVALSASEDMRALMRRFARRSDVTLQAFGWRLVELPDGPCYRPDVM